MKLSAPITVRNQETGAVRETVTNDLGYYNVTSLRPGNYTVTAALLGFKTSIVTDRQAQVAIPAQVNFTLEIGELEETITVSASGEELLNTTTAELAATIDQSLVENLPNQKRNFFDLLALAPNTSPQYLSSGMSFGQHSMRRINAANSFESSGVFAAGASDTASNVSIDGANSQIALYNQSVNIISSSTIKELRLQTASANAEFGYGSNAVNVTPKAEPTITMAKFFSSTATTIWTPPGSLPIWRGTFCPSINATSSAPVSEVRS